MIKKTNAAIQKKVMNIKGIQELIQALGYVDVTIFTLQLLIWLDGWGALHFRWELFLDLNEWFI